MRLFILLVAASLFKPGDSITGTIKVEFGLHCPDKTDWEFKISSHTIGSPAVKISGKATNHFEFRTMEKEFTVTHEYVYYNVEDTCTTDGKWKIWKPFTRKVEENKIVYFFIGLNLKSENADNSAALEKLFIHYLKKECPTGDCPAIRDRVSASCSTYGTKFEKYCKDKFDKALNFVLENRPSSTQKTIPGTQISADATTGESSNTTIFIIIGSVVGVVLLISLIVTYFLCKKKKNKQTGSGMTGTGTNSKTMTKSGTTKQGTTTGTFQKTRTVGTGNTGNTTTGGQRY